MIEFHDLIDKVAFIDGSLRDIYIFNVVLEDWNRLLKILKASYVLECDETIPETIQEIIPIRKERGFLLKVGIGNNVTANCHFFVSFEQVSPIEFDLDPRELQSPYAMIKVLEFMQLLGKGLDKEVFLTPENLENISLLSYCSSTKTFSFTNDNHFRILIAVAKLKGK